ncbi:MAG: class I tRNA ligase family protein [Cypionkella sp.]
MGNTVAPQEVIGEYGADILRLWVAQSRITPLTCASARKS